MYEIYTTAELSLEWGCTSKTARKRALSEGFKTVSKKVDGRTLEAFKVPENRLRELKEEIHQMKQKYSGGGSPVQEPSENINEPHQEYTESTLAKESMEDFMFRMMDRYKEDIKTVSDEYANKIIDAEKRANLLEMSEKNNQADYLKQIADLKATIEQKNHEIIALTKQIEELSKPFWAKIGIKKPPKP